MGYTTSCGAERRMKIAWVFDLDNTLIYTDPEENKRTFFRNLEILFYDNKMVSLFKFLKSKRESVFILTGRHPDIKDQIAKLIGLKPERVKCRQNDLDREKEKEFVKGIGLLEYFENMNDWKVSVLNQMTIFYDLVIYFDDGFNWYMKRNDLESNVFILPPVLESYNNIADLKLAEEDIKVLEEELENEKN